MQVVWSGESPPREYAASIFLAGPTPRSPEVASWRPRALELLAARGYSGVVFVPEHRERATPYELDAQMAWEEDCLQRADAVVFWVPRAMQTLPALTTNVEWGAWCRSGKAVLGTPPEAERVDYIRRQAAQLGVPLADSLEETLAAALALVGEGALRAGAETEVPLFVWRTPGFQAWYRAQRAAGNELLGARVLWHLRKRGRTFLWALRPTVRVAAEDRVKDREVVIARPDASAVLAYRRGASLAEHELLLVSEFRSAVANPAAQVLELPGGSSDDPELDPRAVAAEELWEEVGLRVAAERLRPVGARQLAATLLGHRAHLYALELSAEELAELRARAGRPTHPDGCERTSPELLRVGDLLADPRADWSALGMVLAAITA
ncbi:MAG: nucleoside 2-deoxyribosyltransferase domain-containing protein [Planctomycetota bacterium]